MNNNRFLHKFSPRFSIRTRLSLAVWLMAMLFFVMGSFFLGERVAEQAMENKGVLLSELAQSMVRQLDKDMHSRIQDVTFFSTLVRIRDPKFSPEQKHELLNSILQNHASYAWIGILDANGVIRHGAKGMLEGVDASKRAYFIQGKNAAYAGDVHDAILLAKRLPPPKIDPLPLRFVDVAHPIYDMDNRFSGVVVAHMTWEWAFELRDNLLKPLLKDIGDIEVLVFNGEGKVLLGPTDVLLEQRKISLMPRVDGKPYFVSDDADGRHLAGYAKGTGYADYKGLGWQVLVRQKASTAFAKANQLKGVFFLGGLLASLVFGLLAWVIVGRLTQPIRVIADVANRISSGDTSLEIPPVAGNDEAGVLSESLRGMLRALNAQRQELADANVVLEQKVEERTAELEKDNLERKLAEKKFRALFEYSSDPHLIVGSDGIVDCNPATLTLLGAASTDRVLALHPAEMSPEFQPDGRRSLEKAADMDAEALKNGFHRFEWVHRKLNGEDFPVEVTLTPIKLEGKPFFLTVWHDLTESKRAQKQLELFQMMVEKTAESVFLIDVEAGYRLAYVNEAAVRHWGAPVEDLLTWCIPDWDPNFDEQKTAAHLLEVQAHPGMRIETLHRLKDGRTVPVEVSLNYMDFDGKPFIFGSFRNIEERKQMETVLREREEQLRLLLDSTAEAIYGIDMQGNCTFCNPACLRLLGYKNAEELLGKNMHQLVHHKHSDGTCFPVEDCRIYQAFQTGARAHVDDEVLWRADGAAFPAEYWSYPQHRDGQVVGAVVTFLDITERKQAEMELLQAKEMAEEANRAKSEFLATMSHEIRTPMNGIIGMTELALDTELAPNQREYLDTVRSSAESLLTIINDILDFSKIESGRLEIEAVPFNLHELIREAVKPLAFRADQKGLELHSRIASDVPGLVSGDPTRLRQVLVNLIGNAIKFTEKGEVRLDVAVERALVGAVELHFVVRDTGIGISADQQHKIFEPFSQADSSTTRHYGGTGLGLGISKSLIELMGGRIWLESAPGQGSRFHFMVRLGEVSGAAQAAASVAKKGAGQPVKSTKPACILLVEDNVVNRKLAITRLEQWGHAVTTAENGQQALDCLSQQNFDLILMDIQMPVMGGYEATAKIREREGQTGRRTPILAMTANAMSGDRERCLQAGMNGYVAKPIRAEELFNTIEQALSGGKFTAEIATQTSSSPSAAFDYPAALARADQEVMEIIGELVLEDCPRLLADVVKAVAEGDQELLKRSAHTLKGLLGNFGETPALKVAEKADILAATGRFADLPSLLPEMETEVVMFLEALANHIHKD